jgi:hypothetical protein
MQTIQCPECVIAGSAITKDKRHELFGQVAGGAGSIKPEEFQRKMITEGTGIPCPKTNMRINLRTNTLRNVAHPNKQVDGFDYSEDFDGVQQVPGDKMVYINLKCIVGKGGSQTRSLREVYWFIEGQLKAADGPSTYFANILDGDEAHCCMTKYAYILALPEYTHIKNNIYVGDLKGYFDWFRKLFADG